MKNVMFVSCILLCSLFSLIACTKNNDNVQPTPPQNTEDSTSTPGSDTTPVINPGDSLIITGDASTNDQTALLYSGNKGVSKPDYSSFTALGKGFSATGDRTRSIMKFRLNHLTDSLRQNLPQVKKAVLYLYQYSDPANQDPYAVQQDANNGVELHRVVGFWQDTTITWHTQPTLADSSTNPLEDVVMIPPVVTPLAAGTTDDQVVDITDMVKKIFASKDNKGFLLKLTKESITGGRSYGSVACPDVSKRPKLVIYF